MCDNHDTPSSAQRRRLLLSGAATTLTLAGLPQRSALADTAAQDNASRPISPDEALQRLLDGNARYAANTPASKDFSAGRAARAAAQYPFASILSCADSRVAPELAFDQGPGDLFVVRVAGNIINDDGLASLEYGAKFLNVPLIMVLGHTQCGAVSAAVKVVTDNAELPGHLPRLIDGIKPAVYAAKRRNPDHLAAEAAVENVRINAARLHVSRPVIGQLVRQGKVKVVGAVYDLATGKVNLV